MVHSNRFLSLSATCVLAAGMILAAGLLSGCDLTKNQLKADRGANMEFQDFRDGLESRIEDDADVADVPGGLQDREGIPAFQPYVAGISENLKPMPLVSISVNQTVPLRDVLFELAEQANYDLELDPRITGSIIFTARERPFDLVIQRISEIAGLRYSFKDDVLRVELDEPYQETYKVDYLSYIRTNTGSIRNDVSVVSGEGTNTGSRYEAATKSEADFWGELNVNLAQILGVTPGNLITSADPRITATAANPAPVEPVVVESEGGGQQVQVQPPEAVLQVTSLPTNTDTAAQRRGAEGKAPTASFALNRQAGMVIVFATQRQHEKVKEYLRELKRSVTSQVLIEAKVLEVSLSDQFSAGIDWTAFNPLNSKFNFGLGVSELTEFEEDPGIDPFITYIGGGDFQAAIQAISQFGTVRALASPRMTVLNNQSAVLNVANNVVYFEIDIDVTTQDNVTQTDVESEIRNVPEGVLINVQPSIDLEDRTISMSVRPTITRITQRVEDPAVAFIAESANVEIEATIPELNVQEIDSVIKINSGQTIVMGGLMQDRAETSEGGVPVLGELPVFGSLFKVHDDRVRKTELVIFLRATILNSGDDSIWDVDRDLYKRFSGDRRPLKL